MAHCYANYLNRTRPSRQRGVITVAKLNFDAPFLQQSFRYVTPVLVTLTPSPQFNGVGIVLRSEEQLLNQSLKLGGICRNRRQRTAPIWISPSTHSRGNYRIRSSLSLERPEAAPPSNDSR